MRTKLGQDQEKTRFLESILLHIPHMVFVKEAKELRFVLFNKAGEDLLGLQMQNLLGKNDYDFFPKEQADFFVKKDREVLQNKQSVSIVEEPIDTPHGKRYLRTKKAPILDDRGEPIYLLGISEDITEFKKSSEMIEQQRQALLNSAKLSALGEMAGSVAHEINNPLAIISGYVEKLSLQASAKQIDNKALTMLTDKIKTTVTRIATIIKGLRAISRDGSKDPYVYASVAHIVQETVALCAEKFRNSSVDLRSIVGDEIAYCQPTQISQVVLNLLQNSYDAVQNMRQKWISVESRTVGNTLRIIVTDSGGGIPNDVRQNLMQPFFTTKPAGKGTGLGLSISRGIIESHGGELFLDDRAENTSFVIALPLKSKVAAS